MVASVALMAVVVLVSAEPPDSSTHTCTSPSAILSVTLALGRIEMETAIGGECYEVISIHRLCVSVLSSYINYSRMLYFDLVYRREEVIFYCMFLVITSLFKYCFFDYEFGILLLLTENL